MKKLYFLLVIVYVSLSDFYSQCTVNAFSSPDTIVCGSCATLSAFGSATGNIAFQEDFNGGSPSGWQFTQSVTIADNTCGLTSPDGTDFMWMGDAAVNPRNMTTVGFDLTLGGTICFDMIYATQGDPSPCEGPDEPDEGVSVQYSIDNGATWIDIQYWDPNGGNDPQLTNWNTYCVTLPPGAQTANTMIQWHQDDVSGSEYDHWGIDNVQITLNDPNYTISWLHDGYSYGLGSSGGDNPTDVCLTSTTSYTVQMTDGTNTCTDVIEVVVVDPELYVNAGNDTTICPGDCANLNGEAYEIISPAKTPTYFNNEQAPVFGVGLSFETEMNINITDLNTTSLTTGSITSVCIDNATLSGFQAFPPQTIDFSTAEIVLNCPGGSSIVLVNAGDISGGTIGSLFGGSMCFETGGANLSTGTSPYIGVFEPAEDFSLLNGCDPNGIWSISITGPGNFAGGFFEGWSISFDDPQITGPVNYVWAPVTNLTNETSLNPNFCPTATETFTLSVTDIHNCLTVTDDVTVTLGTTGTAPCGVTVCTPPTLSATETHVLCLGGNNGAIDLTVNGTSTYDFSWSNGATTEDINGLVAGSYTVTVTDQTDPTCTETLTVTINDGTQPTVVANTSANNVCPGDMITLTGSGASTYTWDNSVVNGTPFAATTTTTYTVTGEDANGCTNTDAVTITVITCTNPNAAFTPTAISICEGDCIDFTNTSTNIPPGSLIGWSFQGATPANSTANDPTNVCYATAGIYWVTLAYSDAMLTLVDSTGMAITITTCAVDPPVADFNASSVTICEGDCIDFNDLSTSTAVGGITDWAWDFGNGQTSTVQNPTNICYASAGDYTVSLTVTDANGTHTETFTNYIETTVCAGPQPVADFSATNTTLCEGDCIDFNDLSTSSATGGITNWSWNFGNGQTSTLQNPTNICYATAGNYTVTLTVSDANGNNTQTLTNYIEVTVCATPNASFNVTPSTTICEGDCIGFVNTSTAVPPGAVVGWNFPGATPVNSTQNSPNNICYNTAGTYWATLIIADGTTFAVLDSTGVAITVTQCIPPVSDFTFSPSGPFCAGDCITFTSNSTYTAPATFLWDFGNGQTNLTETPGAPICFNAAGSFNVSLTVTDANGSNTQTQTIEIIDCTPPSAGFTMSNTVICEGQCIFFNNTSTNGTFYQWTFEGGNPGASYLPFPGNVCFEDEGDYTITLVAGNAYGSDTITSQVTVNPSPNVTTSEDQLIYSSHEIQISAVSSDPNVSYIWSPTEWLYCPDCAVTTVAPEDTMVYTVTVTNSFGCSDSSNVLIEVIYIEEIGVPSAFSPNGDGHNDVLYVQGTGIKNMVFRVFNRYGQMVFESTDQEFGWDGTFQGKELNPGVFVYYVLYDNSTSEDNILEGNVTLIR